MIAAPRSLFWEAVPEHDSSHEQPAAQRVRCLVCRHACVIAPGKTGRCAVRYNHAGVLHTHVGNTVTSAAVDPIEKKPLYHYLPGSHTFSIGTLGCNFSCSFCQNADISQYPRLHAMPGILQTTHTARSIPASPETIVQAAHNTHCASVAFTYNEPSVSIELTLRTATLAREQGLGTVLVSNGFQSTAVLEQLGPVISAANIDLKSMQPAFYQKLCGGELEPVLDNLRHMRALGWWLEITSLIIPGHNDAPNTLRALARWIARELGIDTPWHVSAFRPAFLLQEPAPTSPACLDMARQIGQEEGLHFVYAGNVLPQQLSQTNNTLCPHCGAECLVRYGFTATRSDGLCPACATQLAGVWISHPDSLAE